MRDGYKSIVIGDFGLSFSDNQERQTLLEEAVGSRNYMHPDFEDGIFEDVQPHHDLYSFGKIIYFIFSGGRVFSREKHRDEKYNLVTLPIKGKEIIDIGFYELINRFLDKLITIDKNGRYDINEHVAELRLIKSVYENKRHPLIEDDTIHICNFCGQGLYREVAPEHFKSALLFNNDLGEYSKILVCKTCGHVQIFDFTGGIHKNNWFKFE